LWVIKNVRFVALIIAGIILGTCFIKMWHYGDVFSTEYLIVYINSNAAYANVWQEVLSYRLRKFITLVVFMITPFRKLYVYWLCLYNGFLPWNMYDKGCYVSRCRGSSYGFGMAVSTLSVIYNDRSPYVSLFSKQN